MRDADSIAAVSWGNRLPGGALTGLYCDAANALARLMGGCTYCSVT